jgi:hypothetical protein
MTTRSIASLGSTVLSAVLASLETGCVASSTYELAQQTAYAQHQEDQRQISHLTGANRKLKARMEDLEASLQSSQDQLARTEEERKAIRDEMLRLKIQKEQQPGRRHDRFRDERATEEAQDENARLRERMDIAKRRVEELFQQLLRMLERF